MNDRCWREEAIRWFDSMNLEIGRHFDRAFLAELHRLLNIGTDSELRAMRAAHERIRDAIARCSRTDDVARSFGDGWEFRLLCETFFVALLDLALEDFR